MSQDEPGSIFSSIRNLFRRRRPDAAAPVSIRPEIALTADNRDQWLRFARETPIAYGHWANLKQLYKQAEKVQDLDLSAALIARFDAVAFPEDPTALVTPPPAFGRNEPILFLKRSGPLLCLVAGQPHAGLHLIVLNVSDPVQPVEAGRLSFERQKNILDFAIVGTRAVALTAPYYTRGKNQLHLIDLSQDGNPKIEAQVEVENARHARFMGEYLVVLTFNNRVGTLLVMDLSNPAHPITLSRTQTSAPTVFKVRGRTAYLLDTAQNYGGPLSLAAYDLSDPIHPRPTTRFEVGSAKDFEIVGNVAAVTLATHYYNADQSGDGLALYDLASKRRVGFLPMKQAGSVDVQGGVACIGEQQRYRDLKQGGLRIVDIRQPAAPRLIGMASGGIVRRVSVAGETVFFTFQSRWGGEASLRAADITDPSKPIVFGLSPSRATLGYMKRRARRLLHTLATQDPAHYIELAERILVETGKGRTELDVKHQWISMDLLFGGVNHWLQEGHGRGGYKLTPGRLRLRTREERYPELWDRFPARAEALAARVDLPWQTQEAAVKMLRGMKATTPTLPEPLMARYFQSKSPLLNIVAVRAVSKRLTDGGSIAADLAAETFYKGGGRTRKIITEHLDRRAGDRRWSEGFAGRLYQLASEALSSRALSRRQGLAFACLVAWFPDRLNRLVQPGLVILLYATRRPELIAWALNAVEQASSIHLEAWLQALEPLPTDLRDTALERLKLGMRAQNFGPSILPSLAYHASAWIRTVGWELIEASATDRENVARLWNGLLEATEETDALRSAMASPAALALLDRISFSREKIEALLPTRPFLIGLLPHSALRSMIEVLPPEAMPGLIAASSEAQWSALRAALIEALQNPERLNAFWREAWPRIGAGDAPLLTARVLDDPAVSDTFLRINDPALLETANPVYGPILGRWVRANGDRFVKDSPELLRIATHMLPDIRAYGLERVRAVGMSLPFALRLLESELPPSVAVGREFIERVSSGDAQELEVLLALCDSPKPSVRTYGCDVLETRWEHLPKDLLLNRLSENPDPAVQTYLARKMLGGAVQFDQAPAFDRQVLRERDRARRAKELVKRRLDVEPSQDVPLLLEMARSRTPRDVEWALGQLARLALEGVEIEGFTVTGARE